MIQLTITPPQFGKVDLEKNREVELFVSNIKLQNEEQMMVKWEKHTKTRGSTKIDDVKLIGSMYDQSNFLEMEFMNSLAREGDVNGSLNLSRVSSKDNKEKTSMKLVKRKKSSALAFESSMKN